METNNFSDFNTQLLTLIGGNFDLMSHFDKRPTPSEDIRERQLGKILEEIKDMSKVESLEYLLGQDIYTLDEIVKSQLRLYSSIGYEIKPDFNTDNYLELLTYCYHLATSIDNYSHKYIGGKIVNEIKTTQSVNNEIKDAINIEDEEVKSILVELVVKYYDYLNSKEEIVALRECKNEKFEGYLLSYGKEELAGMLNKYDIAFILENFLDCYDNYNLAVDQLSYIKESIDEYDTIDDILCNYYIDRNEFIDSYDDNLLDEVLDGRVKELITEGGKIGDKEAKSEGGKLGGKVGNKEGKSEGGKIGDKEAKSEGGKKSSPKKSITDDKGNVFASAEECAAYYSKSSAWVTKQIKKNIFIKG